MKRSSLQLSGLGNQTSCRLIGGSFRSERLPSFHPGFSHNEIKANTAACEWVKHNIDYESKLAGSSDGIVLMIAHCAVEEFICKIRLVVSHQVLLLSANTYVCFSSFVSLLANSGCLVL